MSTKIE
jgi:hypothetical protein